MTTTILAHFDGQVLVPEQPVDLPVNEPLRLQIDLARHGTHGPVDQAAAERLQRMRGFKGSLNGPSLPAEAFARENIY